jgi:hypothetical protein
VSIRTRLDRLEHAADPPAPVSVYDATDAELIRIAGTDATDRLEVLARGERPGAYSTAPDGAGDVNA